MTRLPEEARAWEGQIRLEQHEHGNVSVQPLGLAKQEGEGTVGSW